MEKYPGEEMGVYAVWFSMIPGDRKGRWDPELLPDKRIRHYWDENRVLGKWISEHVDDCRHLGPIDWDSYYLFDREGTWRETFEGVLACGTPIFNTTDALEHAAAALFESGKEE